MLTKSYSLARAIKTMTFCFSMKWTDGRQFLDITHSLFISYGLSFQTLKFVFLNVNGSRHLKKLFFSSSLRKSKIIWSCLSTFSQMCLMIPSCSKFYGKQKTLLSLSFLLWRKSLIWSIAHSLMKNNPYRPSLKWLCVSSWIVLPVLTLSL